MKKFIILVVALIFVWLVFVWFLVNYAEDLRDHPCSKCAELHGQEVICRVFSGEQSMTFFENGSIKKEVFDGTGGNLFSFEE